MADAVLFCPFCRESFEGRETCPEHELQLVTFDKLGPDPTDPDNDPEVIDSTVLELMDPAYGRGLVGAGALLNGMALGLNVLRGSGESTGLLGYELARTEPAVWTLGMVSFVLLLILRRRRTPRSLRSVRVLVPMLAVLSPAALLHSLWRIENGAPVLAPGKDLLLDWGLAPYAVALASLLVFAGGVRLGVVPQHRPTLIMRPET